MVKQTPAQLKAKKKYNKEKTKTYLLRLNKTTDKDIIDTLDNVGSKSKYIKDLIRLDIINNNSID